MSEDQIRDYFKGNAHLYTEILEEIMDFEETSLSKNDNTNEATVWLESPSYSPLESISNSPVSQNASLEIINQKSDLHGYGFISSQDKGIFKSKLF